MRSSDYWKRRFEAINDFTIETGEQTMRKLEPIFTAAQRDLENQISRWYSRFAANNAIDLQEARRLLRSDELEELRWNVKDYIRYAKHNTVSPPLQLENASAKYHISRLEALKLETQNTMERLFGNQLDSVDSMIKRQFLDNYHQALFEAQKGFNVGWDIAGIPESRLDAILSKPWTQDNRTFSDRIWRDKERLVNELHIQLTQGLITGAPPQEMINNLSRSMNTSKNNAARLITTESAAMSAIAHEKAYRELDVEMVEVVETLDKRTCSCCGKMDGKIVRMAEYQVGVTVPPFHPWCRGTTVPHFDDEFSQLFGESKRAARDKHGKTYYVPSDMNYTEWKYTYVDKMSTPRTVSLTELHEQAIIENNIFDAHVQALRENEIFDEKQKFAAAGIVKDWNIGYNPGMYGERYKILTGVYPSGILQGRQDKHIKGTFEYKQEYKRLQAQTPPAEPNFLLSHIVPQELVDKYKGTGLIKITKGSEYPREIIKADRNIGKKWIPRLKKHIDTDVFTIIYSKNGVHIYPANPKILYLG